MPGALADGGTFGEGRFRARRLLGQGAFGHVYAALDTGTGAEVAIKTLSRFSAARLARFKREFRALADVSHPNLAHLHELIEDQGEWAIVMDLVPGVGVLDYVAQHGRTEQSVRRVLVQLAGALAELHRQNLLHRDIKPSNALVTKDGHLVVLDFGLVTDLSAPSEALLESNVGSAAYMAPEQLLGASVGPAADLYAAGVLLFEALTGQLPFVGTAREVALKKELGPPPSIQAKQCTVSEELVALCQALLVADPEQRPTAEQLLESLVRHPSSQGSPLLTRPANDSPFVGRADELRAIREHHAQVPTSGTRQLLIQGESGLGKSALIRQHLHARRTSMHAEWILVGRCYERETVPYKAFDGLIDCLVDELSRQPPHTWSTLSPVDLRLIARLFPALGRLPGFEAAPELHDGPTDPAERRQAGYDALARMLAEVARERTLVLLVDDLQWADDESFLLLDAIFEAAAGAPLFWAFTCRPDEELGERAAEYVLELRRRQSCRAIRLCALSPSDARDLARHFLAGPGTDVELERILEQGQGHPFLLAELASFMAIPQANDGDGSFANMVKARLAQLQPRARELLELVCIATVPRPRQLYCQLMSTDDMSISSLVAALRTLRLVAVGRHAMVRCFHDRLREAVLAQIPAERRVQLHRRMARALLASLDPDPVEVGTHWDQGDQPGRAIPLLRRGAASAFEGCAFDRSARLLERVLELGEGRLDDAERLEVKIAHAEALAAAGKHLEAAAENRALLPDVSGALANQLRTNIAHQLLCGAAWEEGLEATAELLREFAIPLSRSSGAAITKLLWHRLCLRVADFDPPLRDRAEIKPEVLERLDMLFRIAPVLTWLDIYPGSELSARHLRLALKTGERVHIALGLATEALAHTFQGSDVPDRTRELLSKADELAKRDELPEVRGAVEMARGQINLCRWDVGNAVKALSHAEEAFERSDARFAWQLTVTRSMLMNLHALNSDFTSFRSCAHPWIHQAEARGDQVAHSHFVLMGTVGMRMLLDDEPERAVEELRAAQALWPEEAPGLPQMASYHATGVIAAYLDPLVGYETARPMYERLIGSMLARPPYVRAGLRFANASRCLDAASVVTGERRVALIEEARRSASGLEKVHAPTARIATLVLGLADVMAGDMARARPRLEAALDVAVALRAVTWERQARLALAVAEGGEVATDAVAAEEQWLGECGFVNPHRATRWMHFLARLV